MVWTLEFTCVNVMNLFPSALYPRVILIDIYFVLEESVFNFFASSLILLRFSDLFELFEPFIVDPKEGFTTIAQLLEAFLRLKHLCFLLEIATITWVHLY